MVAYLKGQGLRVQAIPEQLEVVETVPRNPAGKILKHTLRETYAPATRRHSHVITDIESEGP